MWYLEGNVVCTYGSWILCNNIVCYEIVLSKVLHLWFSMVYCKTKEYAMYATWLISDIII